MKRRNFIETSTKLSALGLLLSNLSSCNSNSLINYTGNNLVIIRLQGGLDGLHLVAPTQNDILNSFRPNLQKTINKSALKWMDDWRINPNFQIIEKLLSKGWLTIIPNVGYPDYNRLSHFKAQEYWETGSVVSDKVLYKTGWIGRMLDSGKLSLPYNPNPVLIIDNQTTLFDKGEKQRGIHFEINNPFANFRVELEEWLIKYQNDPIAKNEIYDELKNHFYISNSFDNLNNKSVDEKDIKGKLNLIADCIELELPFSVYNATQTGYDTHHKQTIRLEPLAQDLFEGLFQFATRLNNSNKWKDTTILVYSEFGRSIAENSNGGTDHGTANNVFILGHQIDKLNFPNLTEIKIELINNKHFLKHQIDFREIYNILTKKLIL